MLVQIYMCHKAKLHKYDTKYRTLLGTKSPRVSLFLKEGIERHSLGLTIHGWKEAHQEPGRALESWI